MRDYSTLHLETN